MRAPSLPVQNSKLPTMLPSACVQVLPALRSTKMSPGRASKMVSKGSPLMKRVLPSFKSFRASSGGMGAS
eukprot:s5294_g1.t1